MGKIKRFFLLQTIGSKIILSAIIGTLLFSAITQAIVSKTIRDSEIASVQQKEIGDISYMEDYLGEGNWRVEDYTLYKGDVLIGDGTIANANVAPFKYLETVTGSFFYSFLRSNFVRPSLSDSIASKENSCYLRVAGSTTDTQGNSIVGTYMEANVSTILDEKGEYSDFANVEGGTFYCLYRTLKNKEGQVIGAIVVGRTLAQLNNKIIQANIRILIFIAIGFILMILALSVVIVRWIKSLRKSQNYLRHIRSGELPEQPLIIKSKDEMGEMADIINDMNTALKEKERISSELHLATNIQVSMLPKSFETISKLGYFDIFASMDPAREVGGDFYDFFMLDDKNIVILIADVSGKGIPAALLMAIAKTMIKNLMISGANPRECFAKANNIFSENNEAGLFITSWLGVLNSETGLLTYVNAGHNPPIICHKGGKYNFIKSLPGFVLGGLEGINYKQNTLQLDEGDRLVLYTDGVTEAHNKSNELFGETRLINYLNTTTDLTIKELVENLKVEINKFADGREQSDDITILALEYEERKAVFGATKTFISEKENLYSCLDFINEELEKSNCNSKIKNQINLVTEEIFINIANYSYQSSNGEIEVTIDVRDDIATLIFKDRGLPFNPLSKEDPDITLSASERKIGGLGIFLTKQIMDSVEYKFTNGQNILTLRKKIN